MTCTNANSIAPTVATFPRSRAAGCGAVWTGATRLRLPPVRSGYQGDDGLSVVLIMRPVLTLDLPRGDVGGVVGLDLTRRPLTRPVRIRRHALLPASLALISALNLAISSRVWRSICSART